MPKVRSTPLRLTAILIAVFTASTLLSFGAAYIVTRNAADKALHIQITEEFNGYALETDQAGLEQRILAQLAMIPQRSLILIYIGDNGRRIANATSFPIVDDYSIIRRSDIPMKSDALAESYLAVSGRIGRGTLIMARSREQVSDLGEVFSTIFLISLLPTLAIAAATGTLIARNARGRVEKIRTTLHDLTAGRLDARVPDFDGPPDDLSQIGIAVNEMAAAQAASVASLRQVSADIAHDLKTPIQRVSVMLDRLDHTGTLSDEQRDIIDKTRVQTDQIVKTFQSLLQIAQIEGGTVQSHFRPVDLKEVVENIVEVYGPDADETDHRLSFETLGDGPFVINGERNLLGQIIANLLENALRHTPAGSDIDVKLRGGIDSVQLVCRDTGPGIPEAERANALRRLYRLESSRTSEGSGLGLSLVAAIADLHGGTIELGDNAPGLVVTIEFPVRVSRNVTGAARKPRPPVTPVS